METTNLSSTNGSMEVKGVTDFISNNPQIKRDHESIDDFEHLDPDSSPAKEQTSKLLSDVDNKFSKESDYLSHYNNSNKNFDDKFSNNFFDPLSQTSSSAKDSLTNQPTESSFSSELLDFSTDPLKNFQSTEISSDKKTNMPSTIGSEMAMFLEAETKGYGKPDEASAPFSDFEVPAKDTKHVSEPTMHGDGYSDNELFSNKSLGFSDHTSQAVKPSDIINPFKESEKTPEPVNLPKPVTPEPIRVPTPEPIREPTPEPIKAITPEPVKAPTPEPFKAPTPEPVKAPTPEPIKAPTPEPIKPPTPEPVKTPTPEPVKPSTPEPVSKLTTPKAESPKFGEAGKLSGSDSKKPVDEYSDIIEPDAVLRRIGFDTWFKPESLHPKVEALVYWRDPKTSGVVFGTILVVLLSLTYFSFISVIAYLSLMVLIGTFTFRVYKTVLQAIQKTSDGHPFKEYLEVELSLPQDKVREFTDTAVAYFNAAVIELRRLFLVEDIIDSIKFAMGLWCCTHLGAWFNGMTLIIIAFIALFTLPKVYENNKAQIDANLAIVESKVTEITSKIKASLPIGKKEADKEKEQ